MVVILSSSKGDAGRAFAHHGSTLLTMTPYALFNLTSRAPGVILSPSKGECGGAGGVFWTLRACFYGQTSPAHGRGGLVTLSRQSNQRRTRHRKCLFARRPLRRKIKQNPRLQIFVPDYPTTLLPCNGQIFDAFVALPSPVLFYFHPRLPR